MGRDNNRRNRVSSVPGDAKAIWDLIVAKGERPTDRLVADALVQSGRYHSVHYTTIARWRRAGWATIPKRVSWNGGPRPPCRPLILSPLNAW